MLYVARDYWGALYLLFFSLEPLFGQRRIIIDIVDVSRFLCGSRERRLLKKKKLSK